MQLLARWLIFLALTSFALAATAAERTTYFIPDAQGSPVAAMDEQGNVIWRESYAPYGERRIKSPENNARPAYTGKPEDTGTGLVYLGARWYDPSTARFTGIDPQGFKVENPHSFGRYLYANNSPYVYTDPTGEVAETGWDIFNIVLGIESFSRNAASGNVGGAVMDGAGIALDAAATVLPGLPGGAGSAIKAARAADVGGHALGSEAAAGKVLVIGENMRDRVTPYAKNPGRKYETYAGMPGYKTGMDEAALIHNRQFILDRMAEGYTFVDIGPDFEKRGADGKGSKFYNMERETLKNYEGYVKAYDRSRRSSRVRD